MRASERVSAAEPSEQTSERKRVKRASEVSRAEQCGASKRVSGASERVSRRASCPVLTSQFLPDLNHSEVALDHSNSVFGGLQKCCTFLLIAPIYSLHYTQMYTQMYLSTMVDNSQEYRLKYWATRSCVRSFARTPHSFACLLTHFLARGKVND